MKVVIRECIPDDLETCRALWRALNLRHHLIFGDPTIGGEDLPRICLDRALGTLAG